MKYRVLNFEDKQYVIRFPKNYTPEEKYPVIIFLHGAGTRGPDIEGLKRNSIFTITENYEDFPFIIVAPHCVGEENSWTDFFETLKRFVHFISGSEFTDPERLYCIGNSMGGYGAWQLGLSMPEYFAAIVPICGGGMYWDAPRMVNVPIWAFHGAKDTAIYPDESQKMVDRINIFGGKAKLTIYPECEHDSWTKTYSNPEVFKWLLEHKNENTKEIVNLYDNSKDFG